MELEKAQAFLYERCHSLLKDVRHCVLHIQSTPDWPAAFPALLYCFSTIDLLGALYGGNAKSAQGISDRSRRYMEEVMGYGQLEAILLQKVFRHKLVHLAQLKPEVKHEGKTYSWAYDHDSRGGDFHLMIQNHQQSDRCTFCVSIMVLAQDIEESVFKARGYLARLAEESVLQGKFELAYNQIISP